MVRGTSWWRAPWFAGALVVTTVLLGVSLLHAWNSGASHPDFDLGSRSPLTRGEWWILLALGGLRLALLRWSEPLEPVLDLPLLGFLILTTGGGFSPLDPVLAMGYLAALIYLRGDRVEPRSRRWLACRVLIGLGIAHALITHHDAGRIDMARDGMADSEIAHQLEHHEHAIWRRGLVSLGLAGFVLLAMRMRDRWRQAVLTAQQERAARRVELEEQEKNNWIALTAGLTHGLGNDILAYDIYLDEVRRALESNSEPAPTQVLERVRFLHESNKGRLAFLQFLEAFARQRQAIDSGAMETLPRVRLELVPLIERMRRHLAAVETADLPPEGSDPAVDRQLQRLRDLPVQVEVTDEHAAILYHGHKGVVEFVAYELIKNALRNATGERPVAVELSTHDGGTRVRMLNDVRVQSATGICVQCGQSRDGLRSLQRRRDKGGACEACFPELLQQILDTSFEPGEGGGTGLGLFLIRYFLSTYYRGQIRALVEDPATPLVCFELWIPNRIPDDVLAGEAPHE